MKLIKCECGKQYKHIQSYNRHIKLCKKNINKEDNNIDNINSIDNKDENALLKDMINQLIIQNNNISMENKEMRDMVTNLVPKIGNNNYTINNKFNIQLFLNKECKDALNINDFVDSLDLKIIDLNETRKNGYISGITNIFVRELKQLDLHKRPIHCSDIKREILYIKTDNNWEKDNNDKKIMKNAITSVAKKQINKIKEWESEYPEWNNSDIGTNEYIQMVKNATDMGEDNDRIKNDNKIIKSIAKEVILLKLDKQY